MSNGQYVDGRTSTDAWGFGLKLGYDWKLGDAGYVTPYGSVSGLFQSGDDYRLSNGMKVGEQSYDSMRYELGVDAGYTFSYGSDQALTPYFSWPTCMTMPTTTLRSTGMLSITAPKVLRYALGWVRSSALPAALAPTPM
ncbi:Type V secretory pathway, adhesin AidA [Raoultella terrigena]|uniref:Type V secretory pathway, adhesin AidA n=1 Tax=Raoultella terrigena TaxID=577 RepID=A0A4U9D9P0_RAOTE|nr:Type V secretory pathway, adhesin AidA [Raoultella terrigena]